MAITIGHDKAIAVLGDSISNGYFDECGSGWIVRLCEKLNAKAPYSYYMRNHAVSGDCIFDVKYRLFGALERNPDVLFIAVGVNDTQIYGYRDGPVMPMEMRQELWRDVLKNAVKLVPKLFVFGMLPVDEARIPARENDWGVQQYYRNDVITSYNQAIEKWCADYGVPFINHYQKFYDAGHVALLADDVHPNARGHELLAQWAYDVLKDKI